MMALLDFKNADSFTIENGEGETVECSVLFSFDDGEDGMLIVFTDGSKDEYGRVRAFAGLFNPAVCENMLLPIESETDMDYIDSALKHINRRNKIRDLRRRRRDVYGFCNGRHAWRHKTLYRGLFAR